MGVAELTAFWIKSPVPNGPLGFGVTAFSLEEALAIVRALGYSGYLGDNAAALQITAGITVGNLDERHVVTNMGPIAVRGMWYPFIAVGVPSWAEERLRNSA
jgi:hypothetical protein